MTSSAVNQAVKWASGVGMVAAAGMAIGQCDAANLFGMPVSAPTQANASDTLVAADFNNDGILDLATEDNTGAGFVVVLLGDGDGGFAALPPVLVDQPTPEALAAGFIDGDTNVDLVCAGAGTDVSVLLGNGDGTFQPFTTITVGSSVADAGLADFDKDGLTDLAVCQANQNELLVLFGNGDGTFSDEEQVATGSSPRTLTIVDLDADSNLDLVAGNVASDDVSVIYGTGTRSFFSQVLPRPLAGNQASDPAIADFDGNGLLDIAVVNMTSGNDEVSVLLRRSRTQFDAFDPYPVGNGASAVVAGDFTGDSLPDLLVTNRSDGSASLLPGLGDGTFAEQVVYPVNDEPTDVIAADLDGDGSLDAVSMNEEAQDITPLLNTCTDAISILSQPQSVVIEPPGASAVFGVVAQSTGTLSYQWFKDGVALASETASVLTIDPASSANTGRYTVRVTSGANQIVSAQASLAVINDCAGDVNDDGLLSSADFFAWVAAFGQGCP